MKTTTKVGVPTMKTAVRNLNGGKVGVPTMKIAVRNLNGGKNQQKIYEEDNKQVVYLANGTEFELELWNPTNKRVGVEIFINGKKMSEHLLILRAHERSFLERHIDDAKKLLFDTYDVDDVKATEKAVAQNGTVEVKWYREYETVAYFKYEPVVYGPPLNHWDHWYGGNIRGPFTAAETTTTTAGTKSVFRSCTSANNGIVGASRDLDDSIAGASAQNVNFCDSGPTMDLGATMDFMSMDMSRTVETGRVEEGANSNQDFVSTEFTPEMFYTWHEVIQLKPSSTKSIETKEIKVYCTECARRRRKTSDTFCPGCGTKY